MLSRRSFIAGVSLLCSHPAQASYFSPGVGTVDFSDDPGTPIMRGEPRNMVVVCGDPKVIWGFVDGKVSWCRTELDHVRGAWFFEGLILYACWLKVKAINPRTGHVWREWEFERPVNAIWADHLTNGPTLAVGYAGIDQEPEDLRNSVELFQIEADRLQSVHLVEEGVFNPRAVFVREGRVIIADTFGRWDQGEYLGRIVVSRISTGEVEAQTPVWYPNDVRPLPNGEILVCAEHENRVFAWSPVTGQRRLILAAPVWPFNDISIERDEIIARVLETTAPGSSLDPPKQIVAQEYQESLSLYAPNSAFFEGDDLWVADTDNSRVIILRNGQVVTEVIGLNNPVSVAPF